MVNVHDSRIESLFDYLRSHAYEIAKFDEIKTNGATRCRYFRLDLVGGEILFIKVGEKVGFEVNNLNQLQEFGFKETPQILRGSDSSRNILVTEWLDNSNFGYESVRLLRKGDLSVSDFVRVQQQAFDLLSKMYRIPPINMPLPYPGSIESRLRDVLVRIQADNELLSIGHGVDMRLADLVQVPVSSRGNRPISLFNMCRNVSGLLAEISHTSMQRITHGDFHAPNILADLRGDIRIVDFSDVAFCDNPCWDLGKWLNYLKRFYRVAELRVSGQADDDICFYKDSGSILLLEKDHLKIRADSVSIVAKHAVQSFGDIIGVNTNQAEMHAAIAAFVVNVYTLPRHAHSYPYTFKNILFYIRESYAELQEIIHNSI